MRPYRLALLVLGALTCGMNSTVEAAHPTYVILQGPSAPNAHHTNQGYYPGYGYAVEPKAYSYGWFGAKPTKQWTRHFGYYRNYTEWSAR